MQFTTKWNREETLWQKKKFIHPKLEAENLCSLNFMNTAGLRIQNVLFGHLSKPCPSIHLGQAEFGRYSDRLQAGWFGVRTPVGARDFLFSITFRPALEPNQPPVKSVPGRFPRGQVAGRGVDHPSPSSVEVKIELRSTSTPLLTDPSWHVKGKPYHVIFPTYTYKKCSSY
jgi:hypothetical protein